MLSVNEKNIGSDQYLYLPAVGKARRLSSSAKSEPFLGSDFTIKDLLREAPDTQKYLRLSDSVSQDKSCFVVRAYEKESENAIYAYRDLYVTKDSFDLIQIDYYDLNEIMIKNFFAVDYRSDEVKGQTTRPRKAIMADRKTESTTTFTVIESRLNEPMPVEMFTPGFVEAWTPAEVDEFIFKLGFSVVDE